MAETEKPDSGFNYSELPEEYQWLEAVQDFSPEDQLTMIRATADSQAEVAEALYELARRIEKHPFRSMLEDFINAHFKRN